MFSVYEEETKRRIRSLRSKIVQKFSCRISDEVFSHCGEMENFFFYIYRFLSIFYINRVLNWKLFIDFSFSKPLLLFYLIFLLITFLQWIYVVEFICIVLSLLMYDRFFFYRAIVVHVVVFVVSKLMSFIIYVFGIPPSPASPTNTVYVSWLLNFPCDIILGFILLVFCRIFPVWYCCVYMFSRWFFPLLSDTLLWWL